MSNIKGNQTYVIANLKSGTVIDLSAGDNYTVTGWAKHGHPNQRWIMGWTGRSWTFQSNYTGAYLSIDGTAQDGTRLVASTTPFEWHIWPSVNSSNALEIYVPNTHYTFDLYNFGDPTSGDPITLWTAWNASHQAWNFTQV